MRENIEKLFFPKDLSLPVEWLYSPTLVPYDLALKFMQQRVEEIILEKSLETIWLLEHPPLYTAGTSAKEKDLLATNPFPVFNAGRGGQYTYHGPGQRVIYVLLNLKKRRQDLRFFIAALEEWIIKTLSNFSIKGDRHEDRVGVWVKTDDDTEKKIAAIGIRVKNWVSFHGISVNISPNLQHYDHIVPCGIKDYGVTSMQNLGKNISLEDFDKELEKNFIYIFGSTIKKNSLFFDLNIYKAYDRKDY